MRKEQDDLLVHSRQGVCSCEWHAGTHRGHCFVFGECHFRVGGCREPFSNRPWPLQLKRKSTSSLFPPVSAGPFVRKQVTCEADERAIDGNLRKPERLSWFHCCMSGFFGEKVRRGIFGVRWSRRLTLHRALPLHRKPRTQKMDALIALFTAAGISEPKAKEAAANKRLAPNLEVAIKEVRKPGLVVIGREGSSTD